MKVCLIYSGYRRTFPWTSKNHEKTLSPVSYVHHRDETSVSFNYYKFKDHPYHDRIDGNTKVQNVLNMWHNRYLAVSTAPEGYDVYVIMRYDIVVNGMIDFSSYEYKDNLIYIPSDNDHGWGTNDQMVFGNLETIKKYVSIHTNHLYIFHKEDKEIWPWFHPESYTTYNLIKQGVEIRRIPQSTQIAYDVENMFPIEERGNDNALRLFKDPDTNEYCMIRVPGKEYLYYE